MSLEEMKQNSKAFNELFGLRTEVCKGTLSIFQETWDTAKKYLNSNNDWHRFALYCIDLKDPSASPPKALPPDKTIFFLLKNQLLDDFHFSGGRVKNLKEF